MYSFKLQFFNVKEEVGFVMKSPNKSEVEDFTNELINIFVIIDNDGKPTLNTLQKYSKENKGSILAFIIKYGDKLPQLNALLAFFKKLCPDEYFIFLPNMNLDQIESLKLKDYLKTISAGKEYIDSGKYSHHFYKDLLDKYKIHFVGLKRVSIGERIKSKRTCRFCYKKNDSTTFNNRAHAISEALGNKTVILFDECDKCNKEFSETIEPDIIQLLSLLRTVYGVKGKGGKKMVKGKNFNLNNDGKVNIALKNGDKPNVNDKNYNVKLNLQHPIISQNIYKSLCKYFLSVIDKKLLFNFKETTKWIKGNLEVENLPKIGELITYDFFNLQPTLAFYIRKNDDKKKPFAVGEFRFTCKVLVFIIPLSNCDNIDFLLETDYQHFWNTFKHYKKYNSWVFNNYSNNIPRDFSLNFNFNFPNT